MSEAISSQRVLPIEDFPYSINLCKYGHVLAAHEMWEFDTQECIAIGIESVPRRLQPVLTRIVDGYLEKENELMRITYTPDVGYKAGTVYHRHPIQSFALAGVALKHLECFGIYYTAEECFDFVVGMLLHDFMQVVKDPNSEKITSQMAKPDHVQELLIAASCTNPKRIYGINRVISWTNYSVGGNWLQFHSKNNISFASPSGVTEKEACLKLAAVWADLAAQTVPSAYAELRLYDLGISTEEPIPQSFIEAMRYFEKGEWEHDSFLHDKITNLNWEKLFTSYHRLLHRIRHPRRR